MLPYSFPRIQWIAYASPESILIRRIAVVRRIANQISGMGFSTPTDVLELLGWYGSVSIAIGFFRAKFVRLKWAGKDLGIYLKDLLIRFNH